MSNNYSLPKSTELSRALPKKAIYQKFNMNTAARERFDADISRITIIAEISPVTITLAKGKDVSAIYVLLVSLKKKDFEEKTVTALSRLIDQNMLFVLECGNEAKLAVFHNKLLTTSWQAKDTLSVPLEGLDLDTVWQNIIVQVAGIRIEAGNTLDEQLALNEKREKLQREINRLEKLARAEKQPKKKFEIVSRLHKLEEEMRSKEMPIE